MQPHCDAHPVLEGYGGAVASCLGGKPYNSKIHTFIFLYHKDANFFQAPLLFKRLNITELSFDTNCCLILCIDKMFFCFCQVDALNHLLLNFPTIFLACTRRKSSCDYQTDVQLVQTKQGAFPCRFCFDFVLRSINRTYSHKGSLPLLCLSGFSLCLVAQKIALPQL